MTEKQLYQAFDLQRFVSLKRLQAVVDKTHERTASRELSDDEMDYVAAGILEETKKPEESPE